MKNAYTLYIYIYILYIYIIHIYIYIERETERERERERERDANSNIKKGRKRVFEQLSRMLKFFYVLLFILLEEVL